VWDNDGVSLAVAVVAVTVTQVDVGINGVVTNDIVHCFIRFFNGVDIASRLSRMQQK
jgi:hypothetical protein